jgi:glycerophosphoryl diester phosphodiesterase
MLMPDHSLLPVLLATLTMHVAVTQQKPLLAKLTKEAAAASLVVGHRGASEKCPENTLASFREAVRVGAQIVEFDVYQTKDGAWVVMHDDTCDRTTDAVAHFGRKNVRVDELTLAQIRELDAGKWRGEQFAGERVPTLQETLEASFPAVPMIERKGGDAKALAAELHRLECVDRVIVQAFDWEWLTKFHAEERHCVLGALGGKDLTPARLAEIQGTGADFVHWDHKSLRFEDAAEIRAKGYLLCVYTVDLDMALVGAAAMGCDFITTNRAERLVELRQSGALRRTAPPSAARK